ncbi:hypothetical protein Rsub_12213 [Raphidocelis subcapitata]|uniref:Uncharacterized protein n=1 Tax=Raphidocelis subcapitata TaxID=307507 RepID=A0A2V0PIF8_9CHLO|nr:hypothetical protein Rsub_12213 [Raphidocelis subcapitata]|eukprot:GBF99588.1 hypothetical protein Rsub_12213 [Raphidocelis subcapitata]
MDADTILATPVKGAGGADARSPGSGDVITRATDFFGPALLTHLLLPALARGAPSRVVNVSSLGEAAGGLEWGDLRGVRAVAARGGAAFRDYAAAKLMLLVWGDELHRRLAGTGVDVFSVHPGVVSTPGEWKTAAWKPTSWLTWASALVHGQSVGWGATSMLFAATEPLLAGRGGVYIGPSYLQAFGYAGSNTARRRPLNPAAHNPAAARRLFDETTAILLAAAPRGARRFEGPGAAAAAADAVLPSPDALAAAALKAAAGGGGGGGGAAAAYAKGGARGAAPPAGAVRGDVLALAAAGDAEAEAEVEADAALLGLAAGVLQAIDDASAAGGDFQM